MTTLRSHYSVRRLTAAALLIAQLQACMSWKTQNVSPEAVLAAKNPSEVQVTRKDGSKVVLLGPAIAGDSLTGVLRGSARHHRAGQRQSVALAEVRQVAVQGVSASKTTFLVAGIGVTGLAVAALAALSSGGFGSGGGYSGGGDYTASCPLVYSWNGTGWRLDSGTFGGAITRGATRTDTDNLMFATASGRRLRLKVTNELNETDHLDALSVLAVDHDPNVTVVPDAGGRLHTVGAPVPPLAARAFSGEDALARVQSSDGWNWESKLPAQNAGMPANSRDGLDLTFLRPAGARTGRLVVDANNTPWAAYMLARLIAAHGQETAAWYDSLDADRAMMQRLGVVMAREAFLGVSVWTGREWEPQGFFWEAGPEVVKRQVLVLDLSRVAGDSVRIRLESAPSFWLIDRAAMDYSPERPVTVHELYAEQAIDLTGRDVRPLLAGSDGEFYTLETGDAAELEFGVPDLPGGMARSYLLRSTGWYRIHTVTDREPDYALLSRALGQPGGASLVSTQLLEWAMAGLGAAR